jgi:hypothetical protein
MIFEEVLAVYLSAKRQVKGESERDRHALARLAPFFAGCAVGRPQTCRCAPLRGLSSISGGKAGDGASGIVPFLRRDKFL